MMRIALEDLERPERWEGAEVEPWSVRYSRSGEHLIAALQNRYGDSGAGVFGDRGNLIAFFTDHSRLDWMPHGKGLIRVSQRGDLLLEQLGFPVVEPQSQLTIPAPLGGIGGYVLSVDPTGRYAGVLLYSGQSEEGYLILGLDPLRLLHAQPYRQGASNLEPIAFSPSGQRAALILLENPCWWTTDDDADEETPAEGGDVEWGTLFVHRIGDPEPRRISLRTNVTPGWVPAELPYHRDLRCMDEGTLQLRLPWGQQPVTLSLDAGDEIELPSASRSRPRRD